MNLLIHDLTGDRAARLMKERSAIVYGPETGRIRPCAGCFGCWISTPGTCMIQDGYTRFAKTFAACATAAVLTHICYGSYSAFVKNILDRSIAYLLPFFELRRNEMHHPIRYARVPRLRVFGYGGASANEIATFRALVKANALNMNIADFQTYISVSPDIEGALRALREGGAA